MCDQARFSVLADKHGGHAVQRAAGDVDLAGDRELGLIEALGAVPGEVRVAEHHAAAAAGGVAAETDRVRADVQREEVFGFAALELGERIALLLIGVRLRARGHGGGSRPDPGDRRA